MFACVHNSVCLDLTEQSYIVVYIIKSYNQNSGVNTGFAVSCSVSVFVLQIANNTKLK